MSAGVQLSAPLLAKARETRFTKSISALAREVGGSADGQDVQELLTHRLMTLHAQLTETCYSASCGQSGGAERTVSSDSQLGVVLGDRRAARRGGRGPGAG
mmetsp:Transcript_13037/g.33627  ORF Transcript_13037/g.33627 Transcript_13037/m.33627 type:complete len:101 (-) Transcript_13037:76-378(-)